MGEREKENLSLLFQSVNDSVQICLFRVNLNCRADLKEHCMAISSFSLGTLFYSCAPLGKS